MKSRTCLFGLLLLAFTLPLGLLAAEDDEPDDDEEETELAEGDLFHRDRRNPGTRDLGLPFPLQIGGELAAEWEKVKEGGVTEDHGALDGAEVYLESEPFEWMVFEAELGWENRPKKDRYSLEEISVELGPFSEAFPIAFEFGRKDIPFGEYESHFVSDALPQVIGETVNDLFMVVYQFESFELGAGWYAENKFRQGSTDQWVVDLRFETDWLEAGLAWNSDISVSEGLGELRRDRILELEAEAAEAAAEDEAEEDDEEGAASNEPEFSLPVRDDSIMGADLFAVAKLDRWFLTGELVGALASFKPNHIDDLRRRPIAWNLEAAYLVTPRWEVGCRYDGSDDLPEAPTHQFGVSTTWRPATFLELTVDMLSGELEDGTDRDVYGASAVLVF